MNHLTQKNQWCQGIQKTVTGKGAICEHLKTNSVLATCLLFSGQAVGLQSQPFNLEKNTRLLSMVNQRVFNYKANKMRKPIRLNSALAA